MTFLYKYLILYLFIFISIVWCFSVDISSFDAYSLKLGVNDVLLVESLPSDFSFFVRLSPFNYSLSCTLTYTGVIGPAYVATAKSSRKTHFPCDGWQSNN
jgi:hypothetical protein